MRLIREFASLWFSRVLEHALESDPARLRDGGDQRFAARPRPGAECGEARRHCGRDWPRSSPSKPLAGAGATGSSTTSVVRQFSTAPEGSRARATRGAGGLARHDKFNAPTAHSQPTARLAERHTIRTTQTTAFER
jgi:hypothetical protein